MKTASILYGIGTLIEIGAISSWFGFERNDSYLDKDGIEDFCKDMGPF